MKGTHRVQGPIRICAGSRMNTAETMRITTARETDLDRPAQMANLYLLICITQINFDCVDQAKFRNSLQVVTAYLLRLSVGLTPPKSKCMLRTEGGTQHTVLFGNLLINKYTSFHHRRRPKKLGSKVDLPGQQILRVGNCALPQKPLPLPNCIGHRGLPNTLHL